jgi:RimJ/RimL family protein N-acetyltransferase
MPTISTERLRLVPLTVADADEMVAVLAHEQMHEFTGGSPLTLVELRARYAALATGRSSDGTEQWCNWIVRLESDHSAVGVVQATITDDGAAASVAWEIGVPWQHRGFAAEAAAAMVTWLMSAGAVVVEAYIHPAHEASQRVAARAGLTATSDTLDGEIVWRR